MRHDKLVRDRIPEIIERQGGHPSVRILDQEEYVHCLERKLDEEVEEYHRNKNPEELADILEVVYALQMSLAVAKRNFCESTSKNTMPGAALKNAYSWFHLRSE